MFVAILLASLLPSPALAGGATDAVSESEPSVRSGRTIYHHGRVVYRTGARVVRHAGGQVAMDLKMGGCHGVHGEETDRSFVTGCEVRLLDGATMTLAMRDGEMVVTRMKVAEPEPPPALDGHKVTSVDSR